MNDELATRDYISAKEASRILRVTERQVSYYGTQGKIGTMRAGRRVLYHRGDVERLAATLQVDIRPHQITRQDVNQELIRYVQDREQRDREFSEGQRQLSEGQQQLAENIDARLNRIERLVRRAIVAIVALAVLIVVVVIVLRLF